MNMGVRIALQAQSALLVDCCPEGSANALKKDYLSKSFLFDSLSC